jgi:hypothetical protein
VDLLSVRKNGAIYETVVALTPAFHRMSLKCGGTDIRSGLKKIALVYPSDANTSRSTRMELLAASGTERAGPN